jgi:hypothetical protein
MDTHLNGMENSVRAKLFCERYTIGNLARQGLNQYAKKTLRRIRNWDGENGRPRKKVPKAPSTLPSAYDDASS